jgi:hypothetical protein
MCSPAKSEEEGVVPLIPSVERPTRGPPFLRSGQGEERCGGTVYSFIPDAVRARAARAIEVELSPFGL